MHDQHWRKVLLLLVSKLERLQAQEAIQTVLDAGSEYEQWLHRDLLFAGWCLTEDPPELTMEAESIDKLLSLLKDEDSEVRASSASLLGDLGNATPEVVNGLLWLLRNRAKRSSDGTEAAPALCLLAKTSDTVLPEVLQWLEQNRDEDGIGDAIDCLWSIIVE